jgi:hypothetical protein
LNKKNKFKPKPILLNFERSIIIFISTVKLSKTLKPQTSAAPSPLPFSLKQAVKTTRRKHTAGVRRRHRNGIQKGKQEEPRRQQREEEDDEEQPLHSNDKEVIEDPRFAMVHTDPRFREPPKHQTKVAIDSRFDRMFTHKSFLPSSAPVDKRGKPKDKANSQEHSLRHYYKMDEEDDKKKKKVEQSSDEEDNDDELEELVKVKNAKPEIDNGTESEESGDSEADAMDSDTDKEIDIDTDTDDGVDENDSEEDEPEIQV